MAGGVAGAAALGAGAFEAVRVLGGGVRPSLPSSPVRALGPVWAFHSRPDLRPPAIAVTSPWNLDGGYLFVNPWARQGNQPGPLMLDHQADPVWFKPVSSGATGDVASTNLRPFTYRGEPVLAWWEGKATPRGLGRGEAIIVDRSYHKVARVRAAGGRVMDFHEFQVTPQGTALFTCYPETVQADLTSIGGPRRGSVQNSIFQEVDIRTGHLRQEWRSLDHIPVSECALRHPDPHGATNYAHINSIGLTPDGNLLVSARGTSALYKLDRGTGQVIWRLGGKRSDFAVDPDARFGFQHDARQPTDGTISLFDNALFSGNFSRGVALRVDEVGRRASLAHAFNHPRPLFSFAMGSVQMLPGGNVVVGWGSIGFLSEFTPTARLLSDARLLSGWQSYRALLFPWRGTPWQPPDVAVARSDTGKTIVYASWNGDTESAYWRVHVGASRGALSPIGIARRRGFETAIQLGGAGGYFAVSALDETGRTLGHSGVVHL